MDINALINKVKAQGQDQSAAQKGGGDYAPAAAGTTGARLVGYYEVGQHAGEWQGTPKVNNLVKLVFELIGSKHPVRETEGGEKIPARLTVTYNLSMNTKAGYYKLFSRVRTEEKHMVELLGKAFLVNVVHVERGEGDNKRVYANIEKDSIRKPVIQQVDPESGDISDQPFKVGPAVSDLKAFVWDFATPEMWDSIYIPGEWEERKDDSGKVVAPARSKNVLQEEIASALNFKGLPIYDYAAKKLTREDAEALDAALGDVENTDEPEPAAQAEEQAADPLAGIE